MKRDGENRAAEATVSSDDYNIVSSYITAQGSP